MMKKIVCAVPKLPQWGWLTLIAIILCIDIEFMIILIPCCSKNVADAVNHIIIALSYSYIAAAIFHYFVNVIPYKRRKQMIEPMLKSIFREIQDKFRLCKETITPFTNVCGIVFNKDEFCLKFDKTNLHEDCYMGNGKSILKHLEELRESIYNLSINVLSYREFLTDEHFQFISKVLKSSFIYKGIDVGPNVAESERVAYDGNQHEVGECIYDLYEYSKKINHEKN